MPYEIEDEKKNCDLSIQIYIYFNQNDSLDFDTQNAIYFIFLFVLMVFRFSFSRWNFLRDLFVFKREKKNFQCSILSTWDEFSKWIMSLRTIVI